MLRKNVENDNPAAMRQLGGKYTQGDHGLVPSHKKAARLYQRAADLGDVMAMLKVGYACIHGNGVKLNNKKAVRYWRMGAERGHPMALYNLGKCYFPYSKWGIDQDATMAFRPIKLAADQGLTEAEHDVGCMYAGGHGVAKDTSEAARFFERAAAKGHRPSIDARAALTSNLLA